MAPGALSVVEHARSAIEQMYAAYARGDIEAAAGFFSTSAVFALHIDPAIAAFAGETTGREALVARCRVIVEIFEVLGFRCLSLSVDADGQAARALVEYYYRHKAAGQDLTGTMRHVFRLREGQIERLDEYHDRARVEAFLRLVRTGGAAAGDPA